MICFSSVIKDLISSSWQTACGWSIWWSSSVGVWWNGQHKVLQAAEPDRSVRLRRGLHRNSTASDQSPGSLLCLFGGVEVWRCGGVEGTAAVTLLSSRLDEILGKTLSSACWHAGSACVVAAAAVWGTLPCTLWSKIQNKRHNNSSHVTYGTAVFLLFQAVSGPLKCFLLKFLRVNRRLCLTRQTHEKCCSSYIIEWLLIVCCSLSLSAV